MNIKIGLHNFDSLLYGGQYAATSDVETFPAWCAENTQSLYLGETITYEIVDGIQAWGAPSSELMDRLMSWAVGKGWPTNTYQNDTIQTTIWSILASGQAPEEYLSNQITQHAMLLHNNIKQDLLFSVATSEPSPLPLLILGLVVVAVSRVLEGKGAKT